jgi:hypothetical protein
MAAFSNKEYIESLKSGTKQMERSAELIAAKEMDDDVIAEVYRKKKKEGRLKRTTTAEMSSMVSRAVQDNHQSALADLELRVDALLDTASRDAGLSQRIKDMIAELQMVAAEHAEQEKAQPE